MLRFFAQSTDARSLRTQIIYGVTKASRDCASLSFEISCCGKSKGKAMRCPPTAQFEHWIPRNVFASLKKTEMRYKTHRQRGSATKTGDITMNVTLRGAFCCGKAISVTYSDCGYITFIYPACKADAQYNIVICGTSGYSTLFHIISWTTRLSKKGSLNTKCVFWFSVQILSGTVFIQRIIQRCVTINGRVSSSNVP